MLIQNENTDVYNDINVLLLYGRQKDPSASLPEGVQKDCRGPQIHKMNKEHTGKTINLRQTLFLDFVGAHPPEGEQKDHTIINSL